MAKRVFLIVLDSLGIGAMPDAARYSDEGANTLLSLVKSGELHILNLINLGLGSVDGVDFLEKSEPRACRARLTEASAGKDTTTGHWEMMGIVSSSAMPTYPNGFPKEIMEEFERATGYGTLCNKTYSGTKVIEDFGEEHIKTGKLIVYTSADSVFQIAAHEDIVPPEKLYRACEAARKILKPPHGVGRVIARPFTTRDGKFVRTEGRRDFSLKPPKKTFLDGISGAGMATIGVGKIGDIFAKEGLTEVYPTHNNDEGMKLTAELAERDFSGLCFVNLVDFDMLYGHRQDAVGYARALSAFDSWLGGFLKKLGEDDCLIITADHGCDPSDDSTDHTREHVPFLLFSEKIKPKALGTKDGFYRIGATAASLLGVSPTVDGVLLPTIFD